MGATIEAFVSTLLPFTIYLMHWLVTATLLLMRLNCSNTDMVNRTALPLLNMTPTTSLSTSACCLQPLPQVRINYANPDMVGHTGDLQATIHSCETVDKCVKELLEVCDSVNGRWLVSGSSMNGYGWWEGREAGSQGGAGAVYKCVKELLEVCDSVNGRWLVSSMDGHGWREGQEAGAQGGAGAGHKCGKGAA